MANRRGVRRRRPGGAPGLDADWLLFLAIAQLLVAFALGGASDRNDLALMAIEMTSLPMLAMALWRSIHSSGARLQPIPMLILSGVVLLPLVQLVPVPPLVWHALPGRALARDSLILAGAGNRWLPLSLTPEATWRAFLWLIPPATLFVACSQLDRRSRSLLTIVVLILLAISLLIGVLQVAGMDSLQVSPFSDHRLPNGLFANRNHQAVAMAAGMPLAAAIIADWSVAASERRRVAWAAFVATTGLLVIGDLVTLSRSGLILGGVGLVGALVIFYQGQSGKWRQRRQALWAIATLVLVVVIVAQFGLAAVLARFDQQGLVEARFQSWPLIAKAANEYFPIGTGFGAFDPVYRSIEPPETVDATFLNTAHNDFIQIWLEGGAVGIALLLSAVIWLGRATIRVWRLPPSLRDPLATGASLSIWILIAHSLSDYPLRTEALACVFAVLSGYVNCAEWKIVTSGRM